MGSELFFGTLQIPESDGLPADGSHRASDRLRALISSQTVSAEVAMAALPEPREVTALLRDWSRGDRQALERLMPLV